MSLKSNGFGIAIIPLVCVLAFARLTAQMELTNGERYEDSIAVFDEIDRWTFEAEEGDYILIRAAKTDFNSSLSLYLNLQKPDGNHLRPEGNVVLRPNDAKVETLEYIATMSGTYTAIVRDETGIRHQGTGGYFLGMIKVPGEVVIPANDEGGELTAGANNEATIELGDLDVWTFNASEGDLLMLRISTLFENDPENILLPGLRLLDPDGVLIESRGTETVTTVELLSAPKSGKYTVIASDHTEFRFATGRGSGDYLLQFLKVPGPNVVPEEEADGGLLVNGSNHVGQITYGDMDAWTFEAEEGDFVRLKLNPELEFVDPGFNPRLLVLDPFGDFEPFGTTSNEKWFNVETSGIHTVIIRDETNPYNVGTGPYQLRYIKVPGDAMVPEGDEGGELISDENHPGIIDFGDIDPWTITMEAGDYLFSTLEEVYQDEQEPLFSPELQIVDPDGSILQLQDNETKVELSLRAETSGVYTLIVSDERNAYFTGGQYNLNVIRYRPTILVSESATVNEEETFLEQLSIDAPLGEIETVAFNIYSAPEGVSLNQGNNGEATLSWTPSEAQGPSESIITIEVREIFREVEMVGSNSITVQVEEVNLPPVIIPSIEVIDFNGNSQLQVQVSDPDIPTNQFSFSLEEGPSGSSIDSETGIISWPPTIFNEGTLNDFKILVTDDGIPPLSNSGIVQIWVNPIPVSVEFSMEENFLQIEGLKGYSYRLEVSTDLDNWIVVEEFTLAEESSTLIEVSGHGTVGHFYRLSVTGELGSDS